MKVRELYLGVPKVNARVCFHQLHKACIYIHKHLHTHARTVTACLRSERQANAY